MTQPLVTLGICTYNRAASLCQHCLAALEKLTYAGADNIDLQSEFVQYSNFNTKDSRELFVDTERTSIK
ncbi:hypothetical protein NIES21_24200 [Anabaenopsis circularis NIES-21]|uniref:Uncharacterized protein n=1 Tax=Anabaenopsis circularis NIES-21 TaxID=1085406 RepID=A0A1Z4GGF6_9CYAN|nr:hypothetical protein NIES21_24200 [Anabaenopsis circularis NIES-21]